MATSIDFPASPSVGDKYTYGATTFEWTGIYWRIYNPIEPSTINDTVPSGSFKDGYLWFNPLEARLYTYYNGVWIQLIKDGKDGTNATITDPFVIGNANITGSFAVTGSATFLNTTNIQQVLEKATIVGSAATGSINFDVLTQAVLYYTGSATANWTLNLRGDGSNTLNSIMPTGKSLTISFLVSQSATAYTASAFQVDGTPVTPKWQGGSAPTAGSTNATDIYTYTVLKTAASTYIALASVTKFA